MPESTGESVQNANGETVEGVLPRAQPSLELAIELAKSTHANFQDMVKVADAKATTLAGIQSVVLGVVLSSSVHASTSLTVFFAVVSSASILSGLMVLLPRFPKFRGMPTFSRGLLWIDRVSGFWAQPDAYLHTLAETNPEHLLADYAFENMKIASLLELKFRWLRVSVQILIAGVLIFLLLIVSTLWRE